MTLLPAPGSPFAAAGAVVRDYGHADLKEVEQSLFQPSHFVSSWFSPEVKLGSLAGSMEVPACFGAEIYAQVGFDGGVWGVSRGKKHRGAGLLRGGNVRTDGLRGRGSS